MLLDRRRHDFAKGHHRRFALDAPSEVPERADHAADGPATADGPAAADDTEIDADGGGFDDEMVHPAIISENTPVSVARLLQAEAPPPPADVVLGQGEPVANPVAGALSQST